MKSVEVSIKELIVYLLRRWKAIVVLSIAAAILFGGYGYVRQRGNVSGATEAVTEAVTATVAPKKEYILNLSIDLTSFQGTSSDSYHITLATNDLLSKIQNRYITVFQAAPLQEILKGMVPAELSTDDLRETISVTNPSVGMLNIIVLGENGIDAKQVADAVYEYMLSFADTITQSVIEHSLLVLTGSTVAAGTVAAGTDINNPQPLEIKDEPNILFNIAVGLAIGFVLSIIILGITYLIRLPIQSPDYAQSQLDIRYLGGVNRRNREALVDKVAGTLRMAKKQDAIALIATNIRELAGESKRILFTGTIDEALIKDFTANVVSKLNNSNLTFDYGANVNQNSKTVEALSNSDMVVFVERIDDSTLRGIADEKDRVEMSEKKILGYVLY